MDYHDRENLREFLVSLFGNQANKWAMNEKIFNLTFELVSVSSGCSSAMNYVPRPHPYGMSPFKWMAAEVRKAFLREIRQKKSHYVICLKASAYRMVSDLQMAAQGL